MWSHDSWDMWLNGRDQLSLWYNLPKIGSHCPGESRDKAFFQGSRDHMIDESRDLVGNIPSP